MYLLNTEPIKDTPMIRLKNGHEVEYSEDFDLFFKNLLESIINEAKSSSEKNAVKSVNNIHDLFLKELMDNCIFVTHQLFEISKQNKDLSKFMVTGFIFNSILLHLSHYQDADDVEETTIKKIIH